MNRLWVARTPYQFRSIALLCLFLASGAAPLLGQAGPTATFTANGATNVTLGVGSTIAYAWSSTNAVSATSSYTVNGGASTPWLGNTLSGNSLSTIAASQAGNTYVLTYTVTSSTGQTASAQVTITVLGAGPTATFTANGATNVTLGVGSTIAYAWSSTNAVSATSSYTVNGGASTPWLGNTLSGNSLSTIAASQAGNTYVLTYTVTSSTGQTASAQVTITVLGAGPTATFTANGATNVTLGVGSTIAYAWSSTNAVSATSSYTVNGGASTPWLGNTLSGNSLSTIAASQAGNTYVLTYTVTSSTGQTASAQVTITVLGAGPTATFTANGATNVTLGVGSTIAYAWSSTNAVSATSSYTVNGGASTPWLGNTLSGNSLSTIAASQAGNTYVLTYTVTSSTGQTASAQVTITVLGAGPTATFTANGATNVTLGVGSTIAYAWSSTNAVSATSSYTVNGGASTPWLGNTLSGNSLSTIAASQAGNTYVLTYTVTSSTGQTASAQVTITVLGAGPTATFTANGATNVTLGVGSTIAYAWSSTNAVSATSSYTVNGGASTPWLGNTLSGNSLSTIAASQAGNTYVLTYTVTSSTGQTASAQVTITVLGAGPTATFTANGATNVTLGVGSTIAYAWSSTNAVSATSSYTVNGGASTPWLGNTLSGNSLSTIAASQAGNTYVLTYTVTSSTGQTASAQVTITVLGAGPTATFTANGATNVTLGVGSTIAYAWSSTNAVSATSSYTVNGGASTPWLGNTLSGNSLSTIAASQTGNTYVLTYTVTSSTGQTASSQVTITVTGTTDTGLVAGLSSTSLAFGSQYVGDASTAPPVTVSNTGGATLSITSITVTGANAGDFAETDTCGSVAPGNNCTISVTFTPTLTSAETATVSIADNATGTPQTVTLSGTGMISAGQFMVLSADKSHLVNTFTGKPVYITGEQAYSLAINLSSDSDIELYLSTRQSMGFNFIWVGATDIPYLVDYPDNALGQPAFNGAYFTNMNEAYWEHLDDVIQRAAAHGFTVLLNAAFVGSGPWGCSEAFGWCPDLLAASDSTLTAYGAYLGNRYKSYPNIVWMLGGDNDLVDFPAMKTKNQDIANGILSADSVHLITIENQCPYCASQDDWPGGPWTLNFLYQDAAGMAAEANSTYSRSDYLPTFLGEDNLEGEVNSPSDLGERTEAYQGVLGGATLGSVFGSCVIWPFGYDYPFCTTWTSNTQWKSWLNTTGAIGRMYLGKLMRSREFWKMLPDINHTVVTAGYGSGDTITETSRSSDGQTIIAYIPNGNATTLTVNMSQIMSASNTVDCWWFNPTNGATTMIGTYANSGSQQFTPPDSNDWVLILDDASANLAAPGSSDL